MRFAVREQLLGDIFGRFEGLPAKYREIERAQAQL